MSYAIPKEEEDDDDNDDDGEILGGTGYGRWGRVFLFELFAFLISLDCH